MTTDQLTRMAARGEEDGYDRAWMPILCESRRNLDLMIRAADSARDAAAKDLAEFKPNKHE